MQKSLILILIAGIGLVFTQQDNDWIRVAPSDSVLYTINYVGVARGDAYNMLYGDSVHTHINYGVACTTGIVGEIRYFCTIGGGFKNIASGNKATIGGGSGNVAKGTGATVCGGSLNLADGTHAIVVGGWSNEANNSNATVGGGQQNNAIGKHATVGGGGNNTASKCATVSGGWGNTANGVFGGILSGRNNVAGDEARDTAAVVDGGWNNAATGGYSFVGGGIDNIASGTRATVTGGFNNTASGQFTAVAGGRDNTASGHMTTVAGGRKNIASDYGATVAGGVENSASAYAATVAGGDNNVANGVYSFAAGHRAKANHTGSFVWADGLDADFASTHPYQFLIRATNGVGIGTTEPKAKLDVNGYVRVKGKLIIRSSTSEAPVVELGEGLDYAEGFNVVNKGKITPGSVLIIDPDNPGKLSLSDEPYDCRVAGIVAGAKGEGSGVCLGMDHFDCSVALAGRVYCNVDATETSVEVGDLLTTSSVPGYAMKAVNCVRAQGAILGKAMESLEQGMRGQILVLVTLQ